MYQKKRVDKVGKQRRKSRKRDMRPSGDVAEKGKGKEEGREKTCRKEEKGIDEG